MNRIKSENGIARRSVIGYDRQDVLVLVLSALLFLRASLFLTRNALYLYSLLYLLGNYKRDQFALVKIKDNLNRD